MRQLTSDEARDMAAKRKTIGRKRKVEEDELKALMDGEITPAEFWRLVAVEVRHRREASMRLWAAYRFGEPVKPVDVTTNGESVNFAIQAVDYRTGLDALAPRPVGDRDSSGQDESADGGASVG